MHTRGDFAVDRRLILLSGLALLIGAACGLIAVALLALIQLFTNLFYYLRLSTAHALPAGSPLGWLAIGVPVLGGLIVGLMARFGSERIRGHGIPEALEAILYGKSIMQPRVAVLKPLSSAIAIGSGGPFGAEGPIIMTGGAFGSIVAQLIHLTAAERKTLLVAGAAAGMAATFSAPVAAVLLAVEVLLFELKPRSLVPVALAAAVAAALRPYLLGPGPLFAVPAHLEVHASGLLGAALVGLVGGTFAAGVSTALYKVEDAFHRLPVHWMWWPAIGGLVVGIGGAFQPRALGVGYDVIDDFLNGRIHGAWPILALVLVKCAIWTVALASGTSGGVLAPVLIMGCGLGTLEALVLPGPALLWPLLSMAAVLCGALGAPLTAVVFALELTHDLGALLPLLITATAAYGVSVLLLKRSILTEKIARRGYEIVRDTLVDPLDKVRVEQVMTQAVETIPASLPLHQVAARYFQGGEGHRSFPVLSAKGLLLGVLTRADLADLTALEESAGLIAADALNGLPIVAHPHESCRAAAERMVTHGVGHLPVVEAREPWRLVGIVSRSDVMSPRRREAHEEQHPERILGARRRTRAARVRGTPPSAA